MCEPKKSLADVLGNDAELDETVREAVRTAIEANREKRNQMAAWDGERVVVVEPEDSDGRAKKPGA